MSQLAPPPVTYAPCFDSRARARIATATAAMDQLLPTVRDAEAALSYATDQLAVAVYRLHREGIPLSWISDELLMPAQQVRSLVNRGRNV